MTVIDFERRRTRPPQDLSAFADDEARIPEFHLGDRMSKAMDMANMSVGAMAEIFGVSRQTVGRWLSGRGEPKRSILLMWADGCGVDLEWLETGQPSETALALQAMRAERMVDSKPRRYPLGGRGVNALIDVNRPLTAKRRRAHLRAVAS